MVLEELLEVPPLARNNYLAAARTSAATSLQWYPNLVNQLQRDQKKGTYPRALDAYTGTYWDALHIIKIVVTLEDGHLYWALQGLESEKFRLTHYHDDTFTWLCPHNELSRRGRWVGVDQGPDFWKVEFKSSSGWVVDRLCWAHDNGVLADEYRRE
jgi:hypothetical protein